MSRTKSQIEHMLNLALALSLNHYKFYLDAAEAVSSPKTKALLLVLAESEESLAGEIEDMIATGIVDEIEKAAEFDEEDSPDETPFALERMDTDPRIYICNKSLEQEIKGYTFFLSIAARAKSELISRLFQYFAHTKREQIAKIRRVCETF
ncbi:hypothetical protein EU538_08595 [Candidatus Thorarchaeota archaeon]|nr:MAG: hypothetical protein EU538_08595 [Candidatus Thorarchaeota archaeon]